MEYAGFWKRFGAYWLDVIIMLPVVGFSLWGNEQSRLFQLYFFVPGLLFGLWYAVYLVKRYGGTPGKLILKIKITKLNGFDIGYKEAVLRHSVQFFMTILSSVPLLIVVLGMSDTAYLSMDWKERSFAIMERAPVWYSFVTIAMNVWVWSEFVVMLTNKKRRAIHDFIAGTVVIDKAASLASDSNATAEVTL